MDSKKSAMADSTMDSMKFLMMTLAVAGVVAVVLLAAACAGPPQRPRAAEDHGKAVGQLAADPAQQKLWQDAASKGALTAIDKVPVPAAPVESRKPAQPSTQPMTPRLAGLPPGLPQGARIVALPELKEMKDGAFAGMAVVKEVHGERLQLDLGDGRIATVDARARKAPLVMAPGERVQVELRTDDDPRARRQVLALRGARDGLVSIAETAAAPITTRIGSFDLVVSQVGKPERGTMPVEVRIGKETRTLVNGQVVAFESKPPLTVGLLASTAHSAGDATLIEGQPYAIDLIAWATTPAQVK